MDIDKYLLPTNQLLMPWVTDKRSLFFSAVNCIPYSFHTAQKETMAAIKP